MLTRDEFRSVASELASLAVMNTKAFYIKTLFKNISCTYEEFEEAMKEYEDDVEAMRNITRAKETLESRLVEAALRGDVPATTAQFVLQSAFAFGTDKKIDANVTIKYNEISPKKGRKGGKNG